MKYASLLGLLQLLCFSSALANAQLATVQVSFYSESLTFQYNPDFLLDLPAQPQEKDMVAFFKSLEQTAYRQLLDGLLQKKQDLALNDWLFFDLMKQTVVAIRQDKNSAETELSCWFLLTKAGYDTRLTYLKDRQFVYVYTKDDIFEVPMISEKGKNYANLSSIQRGEKSNEALYMLNFIPNPKGKPFTFYLNKLPQLASDIEQKRFSFTYKDKAYELDIAVDRTAAQIMRQYPFIDEEQYLQVPFSNAVAKSLLPKMEKWVEGLSKKRNA